MDENQTPNEGLSSANAPMGGNANNRRIVVGVDGSEASIAALRRASRIAAALGASVEAVTVWHTPLSAGEYPLAFDVNPEGDARSILNTALHAAFGAQHPVWLHAFVVEGNTPKALIDESEGAEMLVLGSRGHGGFAGLLLGSVSTACAEHARCPVLIMHTADAAVTAER